MASELEHLYNAVIKSPGAPDFKDLTPEQVKNIEDSFLYKRWQLGNAADRVYETVMNVYRDWYRKFKLW